MADERFAKQKLCILVLGMGYFGAEVAERLAELGQEVVGVDIDPTIVQHLADKLTQAMELDASDPDLLSTLGVGNYDICIVGRGSHLEDSVNITMNLKEFGAKYIIAKAVSDRQARILERLGVDMIVFPELDMARQLAENLVRPKVVGEIEVCDGSVIEGVKIPKRFIGKPFKVVVECLPPGTEILSVFKDDRLDRAPDPGRIMTERDILILYGRRSRLSTFEK